MLKSFRKLITDIEALNEVQQNVFDTVKELQEVNLVRHFNFDEISGLTDDEWTDIGDIVAVEEGQYSLDFGGLGECVFSGAPTSAYITMRVVDVSEPSIALNAINSNALSLQTAGVLRGQYTESILFNTVKARLRLQARVHAAGGTITSLNVHRPYLKIQRRSL